MTSVDVARGNIEAFSAGDWERLKVADDGTAAFEITWDGRKLAHCICRPGMSRRPAATWW
jgi:hypothetical protein